MDRASWGALQSGTWRGREFGRANSTSQSTGQMRQTTHARVLHKARLHALAWRARLAGPASHYIKHTSRAEAAKPLRAGERAHLCPPWRARGRPRSLLMCAADTTRRVYEEEIRYESASRCEVCLAVRSGGGRHTLPTFIGPTPIDSQ